MDYKLYIQLDTVTRVSRDDTDTDRDCVRESERNTATENTGTFHAEKLTQPHRKKVFRRHSPIHLYIEKHANDIITVIITD